MTDFLDIEHTLRNCDVILCAKHSYLLLIVRSDNFTVPSI